MSQDSFIPLAEKVINKVLEHPCSHPFSYQLIPGKTCPSNYTKFVKNPIDLNTILKRLKAKKYRTFKEWYSAVDLIWTNTRSYYEEDDLMIPITEEVEAIFENELQKAQLNSNVEDWWSEVLRLQAKIQNLNNNPPEKTVLSFSGLNPNKKMSAQLYTNKEVKQFLNAMKLLKNPEDHEELIKVICGIQPELNSNGNIVNIDIYKLFPTTFYAAKEFVQNKLDSQGIEYPK